ncbi:STAS/SEC14 domain-containing protein [Formosa undariae]|uniref:STAS/SEC14 domain-containing protein n=1 Tax=Formosa undariae TaxID=1325436 RepID=A0ABV5F5S8_9FLAO
MKRLLTYDFGSLKLYDNYVLAQINEGATLSKDAGKILRDIAEEHYKGHFFAYISYRKHSYALDPSAITEASKIKNLVAFAVVSNIPNALNNTKIESQFTEKIYKSFEVISEAKLWATNIVIEHTKNALNTDSIQSEI